ncbi:MAG: endonuclease III [Deltaproteobacteria bacterium]|nr:endonuclease III [Deltaproteobacteria bacterium]
MTNKTKNINDQKAKAKIIFRILSITYPEAKIALKFSTPIELLIATILSAQCTDKKVNEVTTLLFKKYKKAKDYAETPLSELQKAIKQTGFFRQKAKSIKGAMQIVVQQYGGDIPKSMNELTKLPGVGRKTANVVLGNAFNIPGLPVDTHVTRLSQRLGLTKKTTAEDIEQELNAIVPKQHWTMFSHLLIHHGRQTCKARAMLCSSCPISKVCDMYSTLGNKY